jgi:molecular chaperone DnaK
VFTKLIEKNTTIPTRKSQVFSTATDSQPAVSIHVLQGERPMAGDNKTLGKFELMGIPPAPRGVPQIEVTFDIDANGIVNVSAKDMATNKEQSVKITSSSGLSKDEIDRMVRDAEAHAGEDKNRREAIEARNRLDNLVYTTEKSLGELGDKLGATERGTLNAAIEEAKKALSSNDAATIKAAEEKLMKESHKLSEEMYKKAAADAAAAGGNAGGAAGNGTGADGAGAANGAGAEKENVVDADFEEVRDSK